MDMPRTLSPIYHNVISLSGADNVEQADAITTAAVRRVGPLSVCDSFARLELTASGFSVEERGSWLGRRPARSLE